MGGGENGEREKGGRETGGERDGRETGGRESPRRHTDRKTPDGTGCVSVSCGTSGEKTAKKKECRGAERQGTDRQGDRQTGGQTDRLQIDRGQTDRGTDRQASDRQGDRQTGGQTDRQAAPHVNWKRPFNHVQQQLVVSEQQMPRHPTAINPPTGRQPAAESLHHHQGDGRREHTDKVKVDGGDRDGRFTGGRLPLFPPPLVGRLFSYRRQENQLGSSIDLIVDVMEETRSVSRPELKQEVANVSIRHSHSHMNL
ncbi:unnamed protein product [Pleuronectes platessa]|uniref:Uncharacterized protein n=1 Tax=Pleuronectes platessa TaxID=8262 RepID=A0A9N7UVL3_PLEPL|nr:unnamed protein product [Pleuronectes platessa]